MREESVAPEQTSDPQTPPSQTSSPGASAADGNSEVNPAEFSPLAFAASEGDAAGLDLFLDVSLQISVELGRARMSIGDVLRLRSNSVIELDKLAGEPADILLNGTCVARGEVIVVDEKFGVRVLEVVSRARRLASVG